MIMTMRDTICYGIDLSMNLNQQMTTLILVPLTLPMPGMYCVYVCALGGGSIRMLLTWLLTRG